MGGDVEKFGKELAQWVLQNIRLRAMELKERYYDSSDASVGKSIEKQSYVLGKCNAICDIVDLLEGKPLDEIC